ncbi:MAG TPA: AAA family ATPase, partial [Propionibacteriaceae bacterium]|nr:AAA family ATPase [Propionibacteriaceae bacterium]
MSQPSERDPGQERLRQAEHQLAQARADARSLAAQNDKLNQTLREARTRLVALKNEVDALSEPPLSRALVVGPIHRTPDRPAMVDVASGGRRIRVAVAAEVSADGLRIGDEVLLNDAQVLVDRGSSHPSGELGTIVELHLDEGAAVVRTGSDAEVRLALSAGLAGEPPELGDSVLIDTGAGLALRPVERARVAELVLDEVPDVDYDDIGGLTHQIEQIRDAVELPFRHRDLYRRYALSAPKGILLYGPPGCGKTMIAKAVATSLGPEGSHFLSIKGPELLNKYVGETERQIRMIFARARELAADGRPVIVFFDEMDSLFRTRGSGIS